MAVVIRFFAVLLFVEMSLSGFASVNRKVIVFKFANLTSSDKYDDLSTVIPTSIRANLLDTKKFDLVERDKIPSKPVTNFTSAIVEGIRAGADVGVIGYFTVIGGKLLVIVDVYDLASHRLKISTYREGNTNEYDVFDIVDDVTKDVVSAMLEKLPPLKSPVIVKEKLEEEVEIRGISRADWSFQVDALALGAYFGGVDYRVEAESVNSFELKDSILKYDPTVRAIVGYEHLRFGFRSTLPFSIRSLGYAERFLNLGLGFKVWKITLMAFLGKEDLLLGVKEGHSISISPEGVRWFVQWSEDDYSLSVESMVGGAVTLYGVKVTSSSITNSSDRIDDVDLIDFSLSGEFRVHNDIWLNGTVCYRKIDAYFKDNSIGEENTISLKFWEAGIWFGISYKINYD